MTSDVNDAAVAERVEKEMLRGIPRVISLIMLLAVVLLISVLFFRVMATFLVPLFLAAVLAVVFQPLHNRMVRRMPGRPRLAALATTTIISLLVIVPTAILGWRAYVETARIVRVALPDEEDVADANPIGFGVSDAAPVIDDAESPSAESTLAVEAGVAGVGDEEAAAGWTDWLFAQLKPLTDWYQSSVDDDFDPHVAGAQLAEFAARHAVEVGLFGIQAIFSFLFGLTIMVFALYYFFADGPAIIETLMHLSPLDDDYERELLERFADVSRAVVLATILAAIVQGLLAGIGYWCILDKWVPPSVAEAAVEQGLDVPEQVPDEDKVKPPLFLLTVATMLLAIVPFVGAMGVWVPVTLWVYFVQGDLWPAVGMFVYGMAVVSSIDNVIKPLVLHGQSNLHPLLALLSVLGGLQLLGPIGILVGPMLVAFLQALLGMLRRELDDLHDTSQAEPATA